MKVGLNNNTVTALKILKNNTDLFELDDTKEKQSMPSYEGINSKDLKCNENYLDTEIRKMEVVNQHTARLRGKQCS